MTKKYLMNVTAIAAVVLLTTGCNHDAWNQTPPNEAEQKGNEYAANFKNLVLGGNAPDASQTWSTATTTSVTVSLNIDYGESYDVLVYADDPVSNKQATYIGKTKVTSGNTTTLQVSRPTDVNNLYVAVYDKNGYMMSMPVYVKDNAATANFGTAGTAASRRASTTGFSYSVPVYGQPDLSAYNQGTTITDEVNSNTNIPTTATYFKIDQDWTGVFAPIAAASTSIDHPMSIYVNAKWTINGDQRINGGCMVIVGNGGEIVINSGANLSTNDDHNYSGMIYVLPGGKITGNGLLAFHNATEGLVTTYSYNGGTIDVGTINLNGGTLYNANGATVQANDIQGGAANSKLINQGKAVFTNAGDINNMGNSAYAGLQWENACQLLVTNTLTIANNSKLDQGGYIECGNLVLNGTDSDQTPTRIYMGPSSFINDKGDIKTNNLGIEAPTTGEYAFVQFNSNSFGNYGNCKNTYYYGHLQFVYPAGATIQNSFKEAWACNAVNHFWGYTNFSTEEAKVLTSNTAKDKLEASDCSKGTTGPEKDEGTQEPSWCYFAFEDLGSTGDIDFNDVVVRVSSADENGDCKVELCAVGGTLNSTVYCSGDKIGNEVHSYSGWEFGTNTKTATCTKAFQEIGTVRLSNYGVTAPCDLPMAIQVQSEKGQIYTVSRPAAGAYPFCITVNGNDAGKWFWPREYVNIGDAYLTFAKWGTNRTTASDWYKSPVTSKVVTY